jgi:hypothetical protein
MFSGNVQRPRLRLFFAAPSGKMADSSRDISREVARAPEKIGLAGSISTFLSLSEKLTNSVSIFLAFRQTNRDK